jgi:ubiquinol-cytochrome c reductase cytochrome c1 subunit
MLTKKIVLLLAMLLPATALGAAPGVPLAKAGTDIHNQASLQRGARNFVEYCLGCHSAQYVRWNRIAADLGIPEDQLQEHLIVGGASPHDTLRTAMPAELAVNWFGVAPPDLSLIARSRGLDYLYTFLRGYYVDASRPTGVNNMVLANTAMPHVLAHLQGVPEPRFELRTVGGVAEQHLVGLEPAAGGELSAAEYDEFVRDTVNFLDYMGEPVKAKRQKMGVWVVLFLLVFWAFTYLLKREYWKDVK